MERVFEVLHVTPDQRADLVEKVVQYAWDGQLRIVHHGDSIFLDLGLLGGDLHQLAEATGHCVRGGCDDIRLRWETIYDPHTEN
jgi:hypothetical protein